VARELDVALELAIKAGDEVVRIRNAGALGVELKLGDEPVTIADRLASELIVAGLTSAFPGDPIISEELPPPPGAFGAERFWLVDPIDGTKDFIRGSDGFSIMIGLVEHGRPSIGVVHQPTVAGSRRTFYASPDGAFVRTPDDVCALVVSTVAHAGDARLVASASHRSPQIDEVKTTLGIADEQNVGSVGVKLSLIALGVRDLYVNPWPKTKAWDTCAPEAILTRAGGRLTDLFGGAVRYAGDNMRHPRGLVGSNGHIHDEVVARIAPLFEQLRTNA
jgi:3'(2'), 5'-bisphosphate nucleotidase